MNKRPISSWPLYLLAVPAFVAVWSGWVGLGGMCGFGEIQPLPGTPLADWRLDTAITLPIGVEAYAAYALRVWLSGLGGRAVTFARRSAIASLILGAGGQVAYHLLHAAHQTEAPWVITMVVSALPVLVLGMGCALAHLVQADGTAPVDVPEVVPEVEVIPGPVADVPEVAAPGAVKAVEAPAVTTTPVPEVEQPAEEAPEPRKGGPRKAVVATDRELLDRVTAMVGAGLLAAEDINPNRLRVELGVGAPRAKRLAETWTTDHSKPALRAVEA